MNSSFAKRQIETTKSNDLVFLLISILCCSLGYVLLNSQSDLAWYVYLIRYFMGIIFIFLGTFAFDMSVSFLILRKNPNFALKVGRDFFLPVAFTWFGTNIALFVLSPALSFLTVPFFSAEKIVFYILLNIIMVFFIYNVE